MHIYREVLTRPDTCVSMCFIAWLLPYGVGVGFFFSPEMRVFVKNEFKQ